MKYDPRKAVAEAELAELKDDIENALNDFREAGGGDIPGSLRALFDKERALKKEIRDLERRPEYEVGDGISESLWSDVHPYRVIEVKNGGKTLIVRRCEAKLAEGSKPEFIPGGFSAHCPNNRELKWDIIDDPNGAVRELTLRKNGLYAVKGASMKNGCNWSPGARYYYDYNF